MKVYKAFRIIYEATVYVLGIYFLFRAFKAYDTNKLPEIIAIGLYYFGSQFFGAVVIPRKKISIAFDAPVHVLAILVLKQLAAIPIFIVIWLKVCWLAWIFYGKKKEGPPPVSYFLEDCLLHSLRIIPVLFLSWEFYQKLGGHDFTSFQQMPILAFILMICFEYLLEQGGEVTHVSVRDEKPFISCINWLQCLGFFYIPFVIPIYLLYQNMGYRGLLFLVLPVLGGQIGARFLFQRSFERDESMNQLNIANELISSTLDPIELARRICERVQAIFMVDHVALFLTDLAGWKLVGFAGQRTLKQDNLPAQFFEELEKLLLEAPLIIANVPNIRDYALYQFYQQYNLPSLFLIPLISNHKILGSILCAHHVPMFFDFSHHEFSKIITGQVSTAVESAQLHEQLALTLKKLQDTQVQLVQSEKMAGLGKLVAGVAHEMNNPLNFLSMQLPTLEEKVSTLNVLLETYQAYEPSLPKEDQDLLLELRNNLNYEKIQPFFQKVFSSLQEGTRRLKQIVENLRTFARTETLEENWDWIDVHAAIDSTLLILAHAYEGRIILHKEYGDIPKIRCNVPQMNQVFMNILSNAFDAINEEGEVWITTFKKTDSVQIDIKDTGKGIPNELLDRIFEPFFTTKEVGKGTGLGLSIVYGILKQHKAEIKMQSQEGVGTTVTILMPINTNVLELQGEK